MADVPLLTSPLDIADIDATGTPDSTTYLRGDGSWTAPSAGGGLVEASKVAITSGDITSSSTTFVDATGLSVTITTAAVRCLVMYSGGGKVDAAGRQACIDLTIDGTRQGQTLGLQFVNGVDAHEASPLAFTFLTGVLSAASHTFKIQMKVGGGAGTMTLYAGTATSPAILTVIETGLTS